MLPIITHYYLLILVFVIIAVIYLIKLCDKTPCVEL